MMQMLCEKLAKKIHLCLKNEIGKFLRLILPLKTHCYQQMKTHKLPHRYLPYDTRKWKIDIARVDPGFVYRVEQATLGTQGSSKLYSLVKSHRRTIFKWQFHATDLLAAKKLKEDSCSLLPHSSYNCEKISSDFSSGASSRDSSLEPFVEKKSLFSRDRSTR